MNGTNKLVTLNSQFSTQKIRIKKSHSMFERFCLMYLKNNHYCTLLKAIDKCCFSLKSYLYYVIYYSQFQLYLKCVSKTILFLLINELCVRRENTTQQMNPQHKIIRLNQKTLAHKNLTMGSITVTVTTTITTHKSRRFVLANPLRNIYIYIWYTPKRLYHIYHIRIHGVVVHRAI